MDSSARREAVLARSAEIMARVEATIDVSRAGGLQGPAAEPADLAGAGGAHPAPADIDVDAVRADFLRRCAASCMPRDAALDMWEDRAEAELEAERKRRYRAEVEALADEIYGRIQSTAEAMLAREGGAGPRGSAGRSPQRGPA